MANDPSFQQLRAAAQNNPALLQNALQQLSQTNPQLFQFISQNPEGFLQLLAGGGDFEGGDEDEGQLPPNVIQVTQEEKAAIDRVISGSFVNFSALCSWIQSPTCY